MNWRATHWCRCARGRGLCASIRSRSTRDSPAAASAGRCCRPARLTRAVTAATALTLEVRYDNASAIALYESCGFRLFGEHAHYYADGATALRYEKPLLPVRAARNREQFPV